jgi:hypothetical protein
VGEGRGRLVALGVSGALAVGGSFGGAAVAASAPAGATTAPPSSVSFQFTASLTPPGGSATSVTGNGQLDFTNDQAAVSVNLPGTLAARLPGGSAAPTTLQAVLSGGNLYLSWPGLSGVTGGPAWVSFALPSGVQGSVPGAFTTISSALGDVNQIVQFAQTQGATVSSLGANNVDGVAVTGTELSWSGGTGVAGPARRHHHRGTRSHGHLSVTKVRRVERRLFGTSLPGTTKASATSTLTVTLWADSNGELVQGIVQGTGANGGSLSLQVDLSGYNAPVSIAPPSPSDVLTVPFSVAAQYIDQVLGGQGGGTSGQGGECSGVNDSAPGQGQDCSGQGDQGQGDQGHGDGGQGQQGGGDGGADN